MLDTQTISLTDDQANEVRRTLLEEFGKPIYRTLNPHNVASRFYATKRQLERIATIRPSFHDVDISLLADIVRTEDGTWHDACTLKRLRRFEAVARFGRCELQQRNMDPDIFVAFPLVHLSLRLRTYHSTFA